jgi:3-phenylpropionate/trans-cinnamate dioxygenase ferredoxin subunit
MRARSPSNAMIAPARLRSRKSDPHARIYANVPQVIDVCPVSELPPGGRRLVEWEDLEIGVFNCGGTVYAIEDRCSHDDGPLIEGELDEQACTIECPRHGSLFDITSGKPKTLPAYVPVDTFPVIIEDDTIKLEVE